MPRLTLVSTAVLLLNASMVLSGQIPARVRGTITSVDDDHITVKQVDGHSITLRTGAYTTYSEVVVAHLEDIKPDSYIGTASKGPANHWVAVEVVIIPPEMQAGRLGYAPWDRLPDYPNQTSHGLTATSMTNGVVSRVSPNTLRTTGTSMTNGTVQSDTEKGEGRLLSITLVGGRSAHIYVPANAPVTRFVVSERSAVKVGLPVFIKTNPGGKAGLVSVGQKLTPPM